MSVADVYKVWNEFQTYRACGDYPTARRKGDLLIQFASDSQEKSLVPAGGKIRLLGWLELALLDIIEQWDLYQHGDKADMAKLRRARNSLAHSLGRGVGFSDTTGIGLALPVFVLWCNLARWNDLALFLSERKDMLEVTQSFPEEESLSFLANLFDEYGEGDAQVNQYLHLLSVALFSFCLNPVTAVSEREVLARLRFWWVLAKRLFTQVLYDVQMVEVLTKEVSLQQSPFDFAYFEVDPVLEERVASTEW
ncbi:MAG: hypothetical protein ACOC4Z_00480 [Patescibacteria group bacterium]